MRHNTPHPKELRMRYSKLLNKNDIDGHVIEHDPDHDKVRVFFTNRLVFWFEWHLISTVV